MLIATKAWQLSCEGPELSREGASMKTQWEKRKSQMKTGCWYWNFTWLVAHGSIYATGGRLLVWQKFKVNGTFVSVATRDHSYEDAELVPAIYALWVYWHCIILYCMVCRANKWIYMLFYILSACVQCLVVVVFWWTCSGKVHTGQAGSFENCGIEYIP